MEKERLMVVIYGCTSKPAAQGPIQRMGGPHMYLQAVAARSWGEPPYLDPRMKQ